MKGNKIGILIIIIGIIIIAYPIVSNIISSYNQSVAILSYQEQMQELTEEEIENQKEKVREYNQGLLDSENMDIESEDSEDTEESEGVSYLNVLDIGEIIGYVEIPKIDVYLPIYHGVSEDVLQSGVGHVENSSFPIGEKGTHAIFAGHTGLVRTKIFDDLDKLEIGDKFYIYMLGEKLAYQVDQIKIVEPDNTEYTGIDENEEYVTLLTCTPYAINSHRLLVRGTRIQEETVETEDSDESSTVISKRIERYNIIKKIFIIFMILIILILILLIIRKIKKLKEARNY